MKRAIVTAVAAVAACASIGLAGTPAYAKPKPPAIVPPYDAATIKVVPRWTYPGHGKLAVLTSCAPRRDRRVVASTMLRRPVTVPGAGRLLIRVSDRTRPGTYTITLWCKNRHGAIDAFAQEKVRVVKLMRGWRQPPAPALPKHFKPDLTVATGKAARKGASHGRRHSSHRSRLTKRGPAAAHRSRGTRHLSPVTARKHQRR